jgi:peptidoglycan/LPS O-acetylase OafA/YrhL
LRRLVYRSDIDGLRGVAISLVVGFHSGLIPLAGGFIGVDVFFVISGFLITSLLAKEIHAHDSRLIVRFWSRRAARLLPALLVVTVVVLAASTVMLSRVGGETGPAARAAVSALFFFGNHFFWAAESDYFGAAAHSNPFLHTWSLSIEEQFYFAWPLVLLVLIRRVGKLCSVWIVAGLAGSSFLACAVVQGSDPLMAFYGMPFRCFELLLGALLAIWNVRLARQKHAEVLSIFGLAAIACSSMVLDSEKHFPFPWSIVPVIGAALIVVGGAHGCNRVNIALGCNWLAGLGRISYSLYLWHWPILVLMRSYRLDEPAPFLDFAGVTLALLLSVGTYKFVEQPSRAIVNTNWSPRRVLLTSLFGICMCSFAAVLLGAWSRFGWGYSPSEKALAAARMDFPETGCMGEWPTDSLLAQCYPKAEGASILLWGDSHAKQWGPALKPSAARIGVQLGIYTNSGCKPLPLVQEKCSDTPERIIGLLPKWQVDRGLVGIVIAARWAYGMGTQSPTLSERIPQRSIRYFDSSLRNRDQALALVSEAADHLFARTEALGLRVVLLLSSPVLRHKAPHCLSRREDFDCFVTRSEMLDYSGAVDARLRDVAARWGHVRVVDPKDFLCEKKRCPAEINGIVAYSDMDHLTNTFVRTLGSQFDEDLKWLRGTVDPAIK